MKRVLLASFTLAALAASAQAENLRHPETGEPAFVVTTPDGWTHKINANGNLIVFNPAHTASINFKVGDFHGSLDALAAKAASTPDGKPPTKKGAENFSAIPGTAYDGKMVNADGVKLDLHMVMVQFDWDHFAAAILLTAEGIKPEQLAAARAVLAGATIVAQPDVPPQPPAPPAEAPPAPPPASAPAPEATPTPTPKPDEAPAPKP